MKTVRFLTHAAVVIACCGMMMPRAVLAAGPTNGMSRDVALTANGSLTGFVLDPQGQPLDGAVVSVRQGDREVARAVSTAKGGFQVAGLSNGLYDLAVGQHATQLRVWSAEAAPPNTQPQAVLVVGDATRGEYCPPTFMGCDIVTLWTLAASTGALVLAGINQADLNDIEDKLDEAISP